MLGYMVLHIGTVIYTFFSFCGLRHYSVTIKRALRRDLTGGPVVKTAFPLQGAGFDMWFQK